MANKLLNFFDKKIKEEKEEKKEKKLEKKLLKFITDYEINEKINETLKQEILELSTSWNKDEVLEEMISRIYQYRQYEDFNNDKSDFPHINYLERLLEA